MSVATEEITLAELLQMAAESWQTAINTALPGKVEAYDAATQTVTVVPQVNRALATAGGDYVYEQLPALSKVPVVFPRCGAFSITFPLAVGDTVLLVFNQRSIAAWRATGNRCDPGDLDMHGLDGAVAIPGLFPDAKPSSAANPSAMRIGSESDGNGRINFDGNGIELGETATKGVARNTDSVSVTVPAGTFLVSASGGVLNSSPVTLTGTITAGSAHIKAVD